MSHEQLAATDREVIDLLREHVTLSVSDLVEKIEVTATAVRQRLNRLLSNNLIDRVEIRKSRGRPGYQYRLTTQGRQTAGHNCVDFVDVLWEQVLEVSDAELRSKMLTGIVRKMADKYSPLVKGKSTLERVEAVAELFKQRNIPLSIEQRDGQPILKVLGCPYPKLAEKDSSICDFEKQLFQILFDSDVKVDRCQCGEGSSQSCSFQPIGVEFETEFETEAANKTYEIESLS